MEGQGFIEKNESLGRALTQFDSIKKATDKFGRFFASSFIVISFHK